MLFRSSLDAQKTAPALLACTVGFVPEDISPLVTLGQKSSAAIDWRRESPLLQHVSFDEEQSPKGPRAGNIRPE